MTNTESNLIGTWSLKSFTLKALTINKELKPYGDNPEGLLIFTADGHMSVNIMSANRQDFQQESIQMASEEEKIRAFESFLSYAGRWRIEEDKVYVNVEVSLLPNWSGKEHFRFLEHDGEKLTFTTPKILQGGLESIVKLDWVKAGV